MPSARLVPLAPMTRGVDLDSSPGFLRPGFVAGAQDITFDQGAAKRRKGYALRSKSDGGGTPVIVPGTVFPLDTDIVGLVTFWPSSGTETEVMFTQTFIYEYSFATGAAAIILKNNDASNVPFFASLPGFVSWTIAPVSKDGTIQPTLVFTDGGTIDSVHTLYEWPGLTTTIGDDEFDLNTRVKARIVTTDLAGLTFAKQVIWFGDHLMIGDFNVGSLHRRNAVAWGDRNVLEIATGGADNGIQVIPDATGYLKRFIRIGPHLAIYFNHSITICDPTPTTDIYSFETRVDGNGLLGAQAVVDIGGIHLFVGQDNIYLYDGGFVPRPIGDRIVDDFFSLVNPNAVDMILMQHLPRRNLVNIIIPTGGDDQAQTTFSYNYRNDTWSGPGKYGHKITATGVGTRTLAYRCSDAVFTGIRCNESSQFLGGELGSTSCSEFSWQAGFEVPTLGDVDGNVYDFTEIHLTDAGVPIRTKLRTDSTPLGEVFGGWGAVSEIRVESRGSTFGLEYSKDHGASWTRVGTSFGGFPTFTFETLPVEIISQFISLRIQYATSGGTTEIRVLSIKARPTGDRGI